MMLEKEIDSSSPYFNRAATTGQGLKSAEIRFYKINDAGQEVCYYIILLEKIGGFYLHLTPNPHGKAFTPEWQGYQPIGK